MTLKEFILEASGDKRTRNISSLKTTEKNIEDEIKKVKERMKNSKDNKTDEKFLKKLEKDLLEIQKKRESVENNS